MDSGRHLMINLAGALGFASFSLAIALAPGPSWVYVISSTIRQGRVAGFAAIAGNATGIACHVAAAACGLSAILHVAVVTRTAGVFRPRPAVDTTLRWTTGMLLFALGLRTAIADSP